MQTSATYPARRLCINTSVSNGRISSKSFFFFSFFLSVSLLVCKIAQFHYDADDVGLHQVHVLGCRVDILATNCKQFHYYDYTNL